MQEFILTRVNASNYLYFQEFPPAGADSEDVQIMGVLAGKVPCGAGMFTATGESASLRWLFIHPDYRRQGAASRFASDSLFFLYGKFESVQAS